MNASTLGYVIRQVADKSRFQFQNITKIPSGNKNIIFELLAFMENKLNDFFMF